MPLALRTLEHPLLHFTVDKYIRKRCDSMDCQHNLRDFVNEKVLDGFFSLFVCGREAFWSNIYGL